VAGLRTTARLDGNEWVINGEKVFITSGMRADWITVAVRTGEPGSKGAGGISMLVVPGRCGGPDAHRAEEDGLVVLRHRPDLRFDGVRVPVGNLLGEEGSGFKIIMTNFNGERLGMAAMALGFAQAATTRRWTGRAAQDLWHALVEHQVIRHKLVDMQMRIESTQRLAGLPCPPAPMPVTAATKAPSRMGGTGLHAEKPRHPDHAVLRRPGVQILGGMGFMRGTACERIYREVKVMMIGGGAEEIMKELAARQLGL
jgi:acyl-CoA dehydrogenase